MGSSYHHCFLPCCLYIIRVKDIEHGFGGTGRVDQLLSKKGSAQVFRMQTICIFVRGNRVNQALRVKLSGEGQLEQYRIGLPISVEGFYQGLNLIYGVTWDYSELDGR